MNIVKLGAGKISAEIKLIWLILTYAKKIKILNLYHWGRHTYAIGKIYKLRNPKGKLYVKCDLDDRGLNVIKNNKNAQKVFCNILDIADLMTCESTRIRDEINLIFKKKIKWIPNGFYKDETNIQLKQEKIILTVGRLGTEQKATENLVQSFIKIHDKIPEWKLFLVGSMTENFKEYLNEIFYQYPTLKNRIITTGEITNKEELYRIYSRSSIFALSSRWESFAIVMLEALNYGCYFIGTDGIAPIRDIVIADYIGKIVGIDKIDDLAYAIFDTISENRYLNDEIAKQRIKFVNENFTWSKICNKILLYIDGEYHGVENR